MVGEQEDVGFEMRLLLDRVGLRRQIPLLDRVLVLDERR